MIVRFKIIKKEGSSPVVEPCLYYPHCNCELHLIVERNIHYKKKEETK